MSESPTLEEPKEEPKVEAAADDAKEIAARLTELGIDDIGKVEGTVKAAQEAGNLANLLGSERQKSAALEQQLRDLQSQRTDLSNDEYGIDIGRVIDDRLDKFFVKKQTEAQQMQQRQMHEFQKIRNNKNYRLVGKDFEEYTKTPDYQAELMAGKTPTEIFHDMSMDKMRDYLIKMKSAIEGNSTNPQDVPVPHTETAQATPPAHEPDNEVEEKLKNIKKNWKGDDSDLKNALDALLPSGSLPL